MSGWRKYLVALVAVFLFYARQIRMFTSQSNRVIQRWETKDAVAIIVGILLLALFAWSLELFVKKMRIDVAKRVFNHLLIFVLVGGTFSFLMPSSRPLLRELTWMSVMFLIGYSCARPRSRLARYVANVCLVFSPAVIILFVQMLTWENCKFQTKVLGVMDTTSKVQGPSQASTPIFMFVFDEWSYQRSTVDGEYLPRFEHVRAFCRNSVNYRRALSPDSMTDVSIPRMIFQTDADLVGQNGQWYWQHDETLVPTTDCPNLFQSGKQHGYSAALVGWSVPYGAICGGQLDYFADHAWEGKSGRLPDKIVTRMLQNLDFHTDPLSRKAWHLVEDVRESRSYFELNGLIVEEALQLIELCPDRTFAFVHFVVPHPPFLFNADGTYYEGRPRWDSPDDYERTLTYVDTLVGQLLDGMKATGKFDRSMIIITADHSWREEREPRFRRELDDSRRVPLIIKLPGQQSGCIIDHVFCTNRLKPLFEAVFSGQRDTQELIRLVQRMAASEKLAQAPSTAMP